MRITDTGQLEVGQRVQVRTWGGTVVRGTVDEIHEEVKNGRPGITYTIPVPEFEGDEGFRWCYLDQIV